MYLKNKADCCGCTACSSVCQHDAIIMQPDTMGFLYPVVDKSKCINCGLCEKICAFKNNYDISLNLSAPAAYAARHKEMAEIMKSRSGAAFVAISDYVLERGGVVYGAGYTEHFRVVHKRALTKEQRDEFRGSKYVQSDMRGVLLQVKQDLIDGLQVLFSGTPCQTASLNKFVGPRLREKLILVDIVCHGVPGPYLWRDYISYLERMHGDKITEASFRDKKWFGWTSHHESFKFKHGGIERRKTTYTFMFYRHIMFRPSCGECHFCNIKRPSDFTLADFWGWEKSVPGFNNDDKGCSLVLINTVKGKNIFDAVSDCMDVIPVQLDKVLQPNLMRPSVLSPLSARFSEDYAKRGLTYVMKRYGNIGWRYKLRTLCAKSLRKIKSGIKKVYQSISCIIPVGRIKDIKLL